MNNTKLIDSNLSINPLNVHIMVGMTITELFGNLRQHNAGYPTYGSVHRQLYRVTTVRDPLRLRSGTGTNYNILGLYPKGSVVVVLSKRFELDEECNPGRYSAKLAVSDLRLSLYPQK